LNLCVAGTRLVDCGEIPAGADGPPPPPPPEAVAECGRAGTFQLDLAYQGSCAGPAKLKIRHDPRQARRIDLAAGSFDAKGEALDTVSYVAEGCHAELVYRGKGGELRFTFDGAVRRRRRELPGPGERLLGRALASCPVLVGSRTSPGHATRRQPGTGNQAQGPENGERLRKSRAGCDPRKPARIPRVEQSSTGPSPAQVHVPRTRFPVPGPLLTFFCCGRSGGCQPALARIIHDAGLARRALMNDPG
jgi:hypothetical protein